MAQQPYDRLVEAIAARRHDPAFVSRLRAVLPADCPLLAALIDPS